MIRVQELGFRVQDLGSRAKSIASFPRRREFKKQEVLI